MSMYKSGLRNDEQPLQFNAELSEEVTVESYGEFSRVSIKENGI